MALSLAATFRTVNGRAAHLATRQSSILQTGLMATLNVRVHLASGLSGVQQALSLVPDLRLQIRALTCSTLNNYRVPGDKGASMAGTPVSDPHENQLAQGQKWTRSSEKHGKDLPYPELKKWYIDAIARFEIPSITNLVQLLNKAQKRGDHSFWETVVSKDFPKLISGLESTGLASTSQLINNYKQSVWSCAISTHASRKEIGKAVGYFDRIVKSGTFPAPTECIALLRLLEIKKIPFPVLPMKLNKTASTICGMEPAYMPQSKTPGNIFINVESLIHRQTLVAQMGLAMLYSLLQHKQWPTDYFYGYLLVLLDRAQMANELKHVFKVVMPAAMRSIPAYVENSPLFETSPHTWATAIQAMSDSGKFDLAKQWFDEYRADVMPKLCEDSSSFAKLNGKLSAPSRLALLASPYYAAAQIIRQHTIDGTSTSWYDLQQVERLLELDQLREQDKLPRPFSGVIKLLKVFTGVDEHFDMDQAEALIKATDMTFSEPQKLRFIQPEDYSELAWCYRLMVEGYLAIFKKQKEQLGEAYMTDPDVAKTKEHIKFWINKFEPARAKALPRCSHFGRLRISLTDEHFALIRDIM
ncbi:hypothetical protein GGH96_002095 [Coemansia sp. RSA 1972]|nr:hypothetical protein GGH96_002095 [Coemansia sp. RSA 1972]